MYFVDEVVAVPVLMQRQVPSIQKVRRLSMFQRCSTLTSPLTFQRRKTVEAPGVHFLDRVVNVPVVLQRQVESIPKVHESLEIPKDSSTDKVVDVPVVLQTQLPTTRMRISVDVPHVQFVDKVVDVLPPHVQLLDWVMDVHVVMQRQVPTIQKLQKTADVPHWAVH